VQSRAVRAHVWPRVVCLCLFFRVTAISCSPPLVPCSPPLVPEPDCEERDCSNHC
jgi:hypothetical protein